MRRVREHLAGLGADVGHEGAEQLLAIAEAHADELIELNAPGLHRVVSTAEARDLGVDGLVALGVEPLRATEIVEYAVGDPDARLTVQGPAGPVTIRLRDLLDAAGPAAPD